MSRSTKLRARLAELEEELARKLLVELERARASGDASVFIWLQPEHPLVVQLGYHHRPRPEIAGLVESIESLREKLGEPNAETLTRMYRSSCREHWISRIHIDADRDDLPRSSRD